MTLDKLTRCRDLIRAVAVFQERLEGCEPSVSARLDPTPRGTKISKPTEDAAIKMVSVEELMQGAIDEYNALALEIAEACEDIDVTLKTIILLRYVKGDSWEQIADQLHYSIAYIYELHRKALDAVVKST